MNVNLHPLPFFCRFCRGDFRGTQFVKMLVKLKPLHTALFSCLSGTELEGWRIVPRPLKKETRWKGNTTPPYVFQVDFYQNLPLAHP